MPNIIQFRLYLTKLLQKQNSSTFLWFTVYIGLHQMGQSVVRTIFSCMSAIIVCTSTTFCLAHLFIVVSFIIANVATLIWEVRVITTLWWRLRQLERKLSQARHRIGMCQTCRQLTHSVTAHVTSTVSLPWPKHIVLLASFYTFHRWTSVPLSMLPIASLPT